MHIPLQFSFCKFAQYLVLRLKYRYKLFIMFSFAYKLVIMLSVTQLINILMFNKTVIFNFLLYFYLFYKLISLLKETYYIYIYDEGRQHNI